MKPKKAQSDCCHGNMLHGVGSGSCTEDSVQPQSSFSCSHCTLSAHCCVLQALHYAKERGALCIGVTNTVGSAIARHTDCGVHINAGCEIGVASTKAYTAQMVVITMMALALSEDSIAKRPKRDAVIDALGTLPSKLRRVSHPAHLTDGLRSWMLLTDAFVLATVHEQPRLAPLLRMRTTMCMVSLAACVLLLTALACIDPPRHSACSPWKPAAAGGGLRHLHIVPCYLLVSTNQQIAADPLHHTETINPCT